MDDWVLCILEVMEQTKENQEQGERFIALERYYDRMIPSHQTIAKSCKPGVKHYTKPNQTITNRKIQRNAVIQKAYKYLAFDTLIGPLCGAITDLRSQCAAAPTLFVYLCCIRLSAKRYKAKRCEAKLCRQADAPAENKVRPKFQSLVI